MLDSTEIRSMRFSDHAAHLTSRDPTQSLEYLFEAVLDPSQDLLPVGWPPLVDGHHDLTFPKNAGELFDADPHDVVRVIRDSSQKSQAI